MMKSNSKDRKLLVAFGILILLTIGMGITGIFQIQGLSQRVENLGKRSLRLEKAILEMRVNNTIYAMGIRNYVFWRVSRYLAALPIAINLNNVLAAGERFREQLRIYQDFAYLPQQKEWARQMSVSFAELSGLGQQIIDLVDTQKEGGEKEGTISNLLMVFESRLYRIDDFLDNTMGKANLAEIERQMQVVGLNKIRSILFLTSTLISAVIIGTLIAHTVYHRRKQERLFREGLFKQMINLEENERKNLSMAVHDQMGQDLSALKIYLGIIEQRIGDGSIFSSSNDAKKIEPSPILEQAKRIVSGLIDKSHNIAFLLRPPDLDEVGLVESLEVLLLDYKHLTGVNYTYQKPSAELRLSGEYNLLLYRLSQELLNNMAKYAQAKNVKISLSRNKDNLEFTYADDGIGFQYEEIIAKPSRRKEDKFRLGLLGLKERVELLDGSMRVETAPGKGTRIVVKLPI